MKVFFKHFISFLLPITNAVFIPYLIIGDSINFELNYKSVLGGLITVIGLVILVSTIRTFILIGKGTLAPWSPTSNLIIGGIYGYIRNPMISGVLFILIGEGLIFNSIGLIIWSLIFFIINHIYFIVSEEPGLHKRFGNEYQTYKANVPRWIPRFKRWKP
ncbi:methyltransferase family protein [Cohnella lupini]|uniref:Phospholipid methyltransferase n=1 Tax=Cohnella lupini TaxID=1294267 RepID=A0A3D9HNP4_9BACL|nr:isoprenylcysteine carboxylmethyltransferase family protein [Cohnella lupini]RED51123.1 phospholipid methyltransferase [Cohnella lupini]